MRKSAHREPRHLIIATFLLGMMSVFVAGPIESAINPGAYTFLLFLAWAFIEEIVKFFAAYAGGLRSRFCDDPIDPAIYLITSALGFAAAENILFLFDAIAGGDISKGVALIISRSIGSTVTHVIASGAIGLMIGFGFYRSKLAARFCAGVGLMLATLLHAAFNSFIITSDDKVLWVFAAVWILLIALILVLEKIKISKKIIRSKI